MYASLTARLLTVKRNYQTGVNITEQIFEALKNNEIKLLPGLTIQQTECMQEITSGKEELKETVKNIIETYNVQADEYKVQHILPLFTQVQKENILDLSREIYELEVFLQRILFRNQDMLDAIIRSTQTIVDTAVDYSENEYKESQIFLNEKF